MGELDCRGMACPNPVIQTKTLLDGGATAVAVRVDNQAASINVSNFLKSQGFSVEVAEQGTEYLVSGQGQAKSAQAEGEESCEACEVMSFKTGPTKIACLICKDKVGEGDDELGAKLMLAYLGTLKEMGPELWRLILLNAGVRLAMEGNPAYETLKELESQGVSILVCGTCLEFYGLMDKQKAGSTTNMLDVVTSLQLADKTISMT